MQTGDPYNKAWRYGYVEPEQVKQARASLQGWSRFHRSCGKIDVFFAEYAVKRGRATVDVFTAVQGKLARHAEAIFICTGQGHDIVSASIDGLRRSGGSSLEAWMAALQMQIEQLEAMS